MTTRNGRHGCQGDEITCWLFRNKAKGTKEVSLDLLQAPFMKSSKPHKEKVTQ
jgi:hypothetical protein